MPVYYFDLKDGTKVRDHEGTELENDDAAVAHAKALAQQIAYANPDYQGPQLYVSIIHEGGGEISSVPIYEGRDRMVY